MTREDIFEAVQSLAKEKDLFAASEYVLGLGDEAKIVKISGAVPGARNASVTISYHPPAGGEKEQDM